MAAGTKLDYETKTTYRVTLTAEDSFGASDTIMVTIMVADMDEAPEMTGGAAIEYAENGTGRVATYTAVDPEMTEIVSWSLVGTDAGAFDISNGVLTFKKSPDYEMPTDVDGTDPSTAAADDNMYEVTVQATDSTMKTGMKEVMVEVADVDEMGMVTLSARRPQREVAFTATLTDPDGDPTGTTWQWAKSRNRSRSYTDIENADSATYTPADPDRNHYLRATAMYTDDEGSGKSAMATSEYAVQGVPASNSAPDFTGQDEDDQASGIQVTRSVAENTAAGQSVGAPVRGTDGNNDVLTYTLAGTDDDGLFDIDWGTGQIMTKSELNLEAATLLDRDGGTEGKQLEVTVRVTDPSGDPAADPVDDNNGAEVTVMITVTDVNEPPAFTGGAETYTIDEDTSITSDNTYVAQDPDVDDTAAPTWMLSGPDRSKFDITDGTLTFMTDFTPNYEMPADDNMDNTYEVMVVATVGGMSGTRDVKVMVTNVDEDGTVTLNRIRPRAGVSVMATLTDPDGSISGLTWQWYRWGADILVGNLPTTECADASSDVCVIGGAMADSYTPTDGDVGETLAAVAMYTDGEAGMKSAVGATANVTAVDTRNRAPMFEDQDSEADGDQSESTTIMVEENKEADTSDDVTDVATDNVGSPINANDPDPNADPLIYTLSGDDAGAFRVRQDDTETDNVDEGGQIEVAAGTELDYESKTSYMVTLTAEDSFGASDTIMVTIMVTDMDEAPEIMLGGLAISGMSSVYYAENGMGAVETYMATGPDADMAAWSLSGEDMSAFSFSNDGMLTFRSSPDYENPADMGMDNMYMVTITADDGTYMDTHDVMVMVTNEDEPGRVTFWRDGADATTAAIVVGDMLTGLAEDPDGNDGDTPPITDMYPNITGATWQWAKTMTPDIMDSWMPITGETNAAYTVMDADEGYHLRATAMYDDGEGIGKMASEETMMVMMMTMNAAPMFESETDTREVAENTATGMNIGNPVAASDANGDVLTYTLSGTDATSFDIGSATGQLMTLADLDYETKATYSVTVTATDPDSVSDMITVTITVTNVEEPGMVTLWVGAVALTMAPQVGDTITGAVMDPDNPGDDATVESWQWARTTTPDMMESWIDITGATNAAYMVTAGDTGYYLRVMATYTDAVGMDMDMEYSMPTMKVGEAMPPGATELERLIARYDTSGDGNIDKGELFDAIDGYLGFGSGPSWDSEGYTKKGLFDLIDSYLGF